MKKQCAVFVGTYTEPILFGTGQVLEGKGKGIYGFFLNLTTGALEPAAQTEGVVNPSYLALSPDRKALYAVNELKRFEDADQGAVSAFSVSADDLSLKFVDQKPTGGTDPCHVVLNKKGTHAYVSNFMSGSVSVFPVGKDGALKDASCFIQHHGSSVNPRRQKGPHAHSLIFAPDEACAFVPDLGIDKLVTYKTDFDSGRLLPADPDGFKTAPGSGPRHCVFHPSGRFCYLICEISQQLLTLVWDAPAHTFRQLQAVPTVVDAFEGENTCADIHITPDGRFVYGSNRGRDSVIIYRADPETGLLTYVDTASCGGKTPRNFAIDPAGQYLIAANQDSGNIVVLKIDQQTGRLNPTGQKAEVDSPVCITFVP
jgi:6-phosphogluconolactonase